MVGPGSDPSRIDPGQQQVLIALGLAGRLSRLVLAPPTVPPSSTKAALEQYLADQLFPWATEQARAIGDLSRAGAKMRGYARGIVAIEAALADLRFVEMARALPLPVEMQAADVQTEYYAALDLALEPRKDRARDAALVGLGEFSALGILRSARLAQARQVIARVFAGQSHRRTRPLARARRPGVRQGEPRGDHRGWGRIPLRTVAAPERSPHPFSGGVSARSCLPLDLARRLADDGTPESRSALARAISNSAAPT